MKCFGPVQQKFGLRAVYCWLLIAMLCVSTHICADSLQVRSPKAQAAAQAVWQNDFASALDSGLAFVASDSNNPIGYFLLAVTYYSISNQFRTDRCTDTTHFYLDTCISITEELIKNDKSNPDLYFILGSAYGYRALSKGAHANWLSVLKDANQSASNLRKCIKLDSTYMDAWFGIGAAHYWKSAKAKFLAWLPFISDKRKQGIEEIQLASRTGYLASLCAAKALLPVYQNQKYWDRIVLLGDSLHGIVPNDAGCLLYTARALLELGRHDEVKPRLDKLRAMWQETPYLDSCGCLEVDLLEARVAIAENDTSKAMDKLQAIVAAEDSCRSNSYFRETLQSARSLRKKVH